MRTGLLTVLLPLFGALAAPAAAAELTLDIGPRGGVVLGEEHAIEGVLTQDSSPLAGQLVTLALRPFPYTGVFTEVDRATTGPDGDYRFDRRLDRNAQIQVAGADAAATARASVFPKARISHRAVGPDRVRLTQTLTGTKGVPVEGRTLFYFGRTKARSAAYAKSSKPRRVAAGRYVARVTLRVPKRFKGRFSYAACFRAAAGTGLGDPKVRCPSQRFSFK